MIWKRPVIKELSVLSGIIDIYGGLRVVITEAWRLRFHVLWEEMAFVVPDVWVEEPVIWDHIPWYTGKVKWFISEWIRSRNYPVLPTPIKLYSLRCLEHRGRKGSLDLGRIVET